MAEVKEVEEEIEKDSEEEVEKEEPKYLEGYSIEKKDRYHTVPFFEEKYMVDIRISFTVKESNHLDRQLKNYTAQSEKIEKKGVDATDEMYKKYEEALVNFLSAFVRRQEDVDLLKRLVLEVPEDDDEFVSPSDLMELADRALNTNKRNIEEAAKKA